MLVCDVCGCVMDIQALQQPFDPDCCWRCQSKLRRIALDWPNTEFEPRF